MVSSACIASGSHVTLHYRIAVLYEGDEHEVMSTFEATPATLQVGTGQLAAPLEDRLLGLTEGEEANFELGPGEGFGQRTAELVQTLSRATFDANTDPEVEYLPGDIVEFNSPDGGQFAGVLKRHTADTVVVDFNHPLAGLPVRFSVQVIGVL
jgi:FKBP-type peptidyl-prolyl cis-trans isomerase SlpA